MVLLSHAGNPQWDQMGIYAVFAFFILSGYVVSYILDNTYLRINNGLRKYILNRVLRVYPLYWVVLVPGAALLWYFPAACREVNPYFAMPQNIFDFTVILKTITTFGESHLRGLESAMVLPVSWTIGVELLYWLVIPYVLYKPLYRRIFLSYAVVYTVLAALLPVQMTTMRVFSPLAAALPFAAGLELYRSTKTGRKIMPRWLFVLASVVFIVLAFFSKQFFAINLYMGFYISLALSFLIIAYLCQVDLKTLPRWLRHSDTFLGNLSFPLYLLHLPVLASIHVLFPAWELGGTIYLWSALGASLMASVLLHYSFEVQIDRLRARVRS